MKYNKITNEAILYGPEINEAFRALGVSYIANSAFGPDETMTISHHEAAAVVAAMDREGLSLQTGGERSSFLLDFSDDLGAILIRGFNCPESIDKDIFGPEDLVPATESVVVDMPLVLVGAEELVPSGAMAV